MLVPPGDGVGLDLKDATEELLPEHKRLLPLPAHQTLNVWS